MYHLTNIFLDRNPILDPEKTDKSWSKKAISCSPSISGCILGIPIEKISDGKELWIYKTDDTDYINSDEWDTKYTQEVLFFNKTKFLLVGHIDGLTTLQLSSFLEDYYGVIHQVEESLRDRFLLLQIQIIDDFLVKNSITDIFGKIQKKVW